MSAITRDTLLELRDRKIVWLFIIVTVLMAVAVFFSRDAGMQFQMGDADQRSMFAQSGLFVGMFNGYVGFMVFLGVLASAGLLPRMLERGRIDFYLAKPLSRASLYLRRLWAILLVYGGMIAVSSLIIYVAYVTAHGDTSTDALLVLVSKLIIFFFWLAIIALFGLVSGSTAMSIISIFVLWTLESIFSAAVMAKDALTTFFGNPLPAQVAEIVYYVLPTNGKASDLITAAFLGQAVDDWTPLWTTVLFVAAAVYAASQIIQRKDF